MFVINWKTRRRSIGLKCGLNLNLMFVINWKTRGSIGLKCWIESQSNVCDKLEDKEKYADKEFGGKISAEGRKRWLGGKDWGNFEKA